MPLIKNPFKSKIVPTATQNTHASTPEDPLTPPPTVASTGESPRLAASIKKPPPDPEYKLSSVTPEGTFMPPSPPEKTSFMSRFKPSMTTTHAARSTSTPKESDSGFLIPRESFDGYRRSFDIRPSMDGSGIVNDGRPSRASLDLLSATMSASPRRTSAGMVQPLSTTTTTTTPMTESSSGRKENVLAPPLSRDNAEENEFEDVQLDEEGVATKKKRFWNRATLGGKKDGQDENELRTIKADAKLTDGVSNGRKSIGDSAMPASESRLENGSQKIENGTQKDIVTETNHVEAVDAKA